MSYFSVKSEHTREKGCRKCFPRITLLNVFLDSFKKNLLLFVNKPSLQVSVKRKAETKPLQNISYSCRCSEVTSLVLITGNLCNPRFSFPFIIVYILYEPREIKLKLFPFNP